MFKGLCDFRASNFFKMSKNSLKTPTIIIHNIFKHGRETHESSRKSTLGSANFKIFTPKVKHDQLSIKNAILFFSNKKWRQCLNITSRPLGRVFLHVLFSISGCNWSKKSKQA